MVPVDDRIALGSVGLEGFERPRAQARSATSASRIAAGSAPEVAA